MSSTPVVCTYQGAFGPPHLGHKGAAQIIANKLVDLYPGSPITVLFMPTSNVSSKESLSKSKTSVVNNETESQASPYISEIERKDILDIYCEELKKEVPGVNFETSDIEYNLGPTKGTSTIYTLEKLHEKYPDATLVLAMGRDNGVQLPWWANIQKYDGLVDKILMVDREGFVMKEDNKFQPGNVFQGSEMAIPIEFEEKAPWAIKLNTADTEKQPYPASKIFENDNEVSNAIKSLMSKMYLLKAPMNISSSQIRDALAFVLKSVGPNAANYMMKNKIGMRTRKDVQTNVEQLGGRGRKTRAKKMKSKRGSKGTRKH